MNNTLKYMFNYKTNKINSFGEEQYNITKIIVHSIIGLLILIVLFGSFGTINAGERGIKTRFGAVVGDTINSGLYFKLPLIENVISIDVKTQKEQVSASASSKDLQLVLKEKVDLNWTKDIVKELLWRPAQVAILNKESTTELNKIEEIDIVYEHLNRHLGEKFGVHVPFPTEEDKPLPEYPTNTNEITAF